MGNGCGREGSDYLYAPPPGQPWLPGLESPKCKGRQVPSTLAVPPVTSRPSDSGQESSRSRCKGHPSRARTRARIGQGASHPLGTPCMPPRVKTSTHAPTSHPLGHGVAGMGSCTPQPASNPPRRQPASPFGVWPPLEGKGLQGTIMSLGPLHNCPLCSL